MDSRTDNTLLRASFSLNAFTAAAFLAALSPHVSSFAQPLAQHKSCAAA
jgi:hypothetical protein